MDQATETYDTAMYFCEIIKSVAVMFGKLTKMWMWRKKTLNWTIVHLILVQLIYTANILATILNLGLS